MNGAGLRLRPLIELARLETWTGPRGALYVARVGKGCRPYLQDCVSATN